MGHHRIVLSRMARSNFLGPVVDWMLCVALAVAANWDTVWAQNFGDSSVYEQKAVLFIDHVVSVGKAPHLSQDQENRLLSYFRKAVRPGRRLTCFQIPETALDGFKKAVPRPVLTVYDIERSVNEIMLPVMRDIIAAQRQARAQELQTEADRQHFLIQKAKELNIDADLMGRIYSYSYVAVPYITDFAESESATDVVSGGIAWFQVSVTGDAVNFASVRTTESEGWEDNNLLVGGVYHTSIFVGGTFVTNLDNSIYQRDDFRMSDQVLEVSGDKLYLTVGKQQGLRLDDRYSVLEKVEGRGMQNRGFARITRLLRGANGSPVRSEAKMVTGRPPAKGLIIREIINNGLSSEFILAYFPYRVVSGQLGDGTQGSVVRIPSGSRFAGLLELGLTKNIGRYFGITQLFAGVRVMGGITKTGLAVEESQNSYKESHTFLLGLNGGLTKRFYRRSLGIEIGGRTGIIYLRNQSEDSVNNVKRVISYAGILMSAEGGVSLWLSPKLSLHILAERNWGGGSWAYFRNKQDISGDTARQPKLEFSPIGLKLVITGNKLF